MKITSPPSRIAASFIAFFVSCHAIAQDTVRVLSSRSVLSGGRTITLQRIEPPAPAPTPPQGVMASSHQGEVETAGSRPSLPSDALPPWRLRKFELLSLSCTVKESGITSVRWWHEGKEYRILSSIDFNWLRGIGSFSAGETDYTVFMGIGHEMPAEMRAQLQSRGVKVPMAEPAPPSLIEEGAKTQSRYVVESVPDSGAEVEAFFAINDLHRYFDAHREELIAQAAENERRQKEHAAYLKANPPVPQDVTIQFWPKRGSRYLKKGGSQ